MPGYVSKGGLRFIRRLWMSWNAHVLGSPVKLRTHRPLDPSVMLSPNETNEVAEIVGTTTVTSKLQDAVCLAWSTVVHETVVVPISNVAPTVGVQLVEMGPTPPVTCGFG